MAAHRKNKNNNLLPFLVISAIVLVAAYFIFQKGGSTTSSVQPTQPPAANKPVKNTVSPVTAVPTESGPVGVNQLTAKAGPKSGQVTLSWTKAASDTDKYSVVYGIVSGKYIYGALNVVTISSKVSNYSYVVTSLVPGKRYYFAIEPQKNGKSMPTTGEVSVVAP